MELEKLKFDAMIQEHIPSQLLLKFRQHGLRCITDSHSAVSVAFVDIPNFSDRIKSFAPRQVVRIVAYYFHVYNAVALKFKVFRLKSFGDASVFISGVNKEPTDDAGRDTAAQDAFVIGSFCGYIIQLFSPSFSHFPQRLASFAESFKHETDGPMAAMVKVRCGMHSGPATSGMIDVGKTPSFEVYGPTLSLCQRMQATALPGRASASATFKELIETVDATGVFEFDAVKRAVVRGRGTVSSYPVKSVQLAVDEVLLHQLKIEHAQAMQAFRHVDKASALRSSQQESSAHKSSA
jgi:class 3 adenylate cyclase